MKRLSFLTLTLTSLTITCLDSPRDAIGLWLSLSFGIGRFYIKADRVIGEAFFIKAERL